MGDPLPDRHPPPQQQSTDVFQLSRLERGQIDLPFLRHRLAKKIAKRVLWLFLFSTVSVIVLVVALAVVDACFIYGHIITPSDRLITEKSVLAVIAATIAQVGAAAGAIVYAVFKERQEPSQDSDATE